MWLFGSCGQSGLTWGKKVVEVNPRHFKCLWFILSAKSPPPPPTVMYRGTAPRLDCCLPRRDCSTHGGGGDGGGWGGQGAPKLGEMKKRKDNLLGAFAKGSRKLKLKSTLKGPSHEIEILNFRVSHNEGNEAKTSSPLEWHPILIGQGRP